MLIDNLLTQPAYLGPIAHSQTLPAPVCHVQQTPPQVELLLQFVPVLQDSSELLKRTQVTNALVSYIIALLLLDYTSKQYLELGSTCLIEIFVQQVSQ